MTPMYRFLMEDELSIYELSAKQVMRRSSKYAIIYGWLYRRSLIQTCLRCIIEDDGRSILRDIHEEDCGSHEGVWTTA